LDWGVKVGKQLKKNRGGGRDKKKGIYLGCFGGGSTCVRAFLGASKRIEQKIGKKKGSFVGRAQEWATYNGEP